MRWSKLRALVRERFAEPFDQRLDIHSAAYGNCSCGHAWLTLDGNVIANFCTRAYYIAQGMEPSSPAPNPKYKKHLTAFGEMSRQDVYRALWDYIHDLSIDQALASNDMLVQALAIIDTRAGKRKLAAIDEGQLHPLAAFLLALRRDAKKHMTPAEFLAKRNAELATA